MAIFTGNGGNNEIRGGDAADVINGLGGHDFLEGGRGADTIRGGAGNDVLHDNIQYRSDDEAVDRLFGEDGDDVLWVSSGDFADGGAGDDIVRVTRDNPASLVGGTGRDTLQIEYNADISLSSLSGFERLEGWGNGSTNSSLTAAQLGAFAVIGAMDGADHVGFTLTAGGSASLVLDARIATITIEGSAQAETLTFAAATTAALDYIGGDGDGTITAGAGADEIKGGYGADVLRGGAGDDIIYDNRGQNRTDDAAVDRVFGDGGDDVIIVGLGDSADGGSGNDELNAEYAATLRGGDGDDVLAGSRGDDTLDGGAGIDTASYLAANDDVFVNLALTVRQNTDYSGRDLLVAIENLIGGSGNDRLTGNALDNVIQGALGDDRIDGGGGSDTASYSLSNLEAVVDLRISGAQDTGYSGVDTLISIENLVGSDYDDTLTGNGTANVIEGGGGDDRLNGQGGADTASYAGAGRGVAVSLAIVGAQNTGGAGVDTLALFENLRGSAFGDRLTGDGGANRLEGLGGADTLTGGAGADTLVGGLGNDTYVVDAGDVIVEAAGGGSDRVQTAIGWTLATNLERLTLTGAAAVNGTGNSAANALVGNGAANRLTGLAGDDTLDGGGGADRLDGGAGADQLTGGAGSDIFDFNLATDSSAAAPDVILGFDGPGGAAGDLIDLSGIDAGAAAGDQAFRFNSVAAGGISLIAQGADTLLRGNTDADADFEFAILIRDGATLPGAYTAADFIL